MLQDIRPVVTPQTSNLTRILMAGKRGATSDLNHDNWNQEEQPEERGTFQKASVDALKGRVIKTARRRNPIRSEDSEKTSAFVGFTGFSTKPANTDFSFLKDISKTDSAPKTNGIDKQASTKPSPSVNLFTNTKSTTSIFGATAVTTENNTTNIFGSNTTKTSKSNTIVCSLSTGIKKSENYCSRLKGLNESVSKWIVQKVEENPLISLQPIFKDYEKYLDALEKEESSTPSIVKLTSVASTKPVPTFNFVPSADKNTKAIPDSTSEKLPEKKEELSKTTFKIGAPTTTVSSSASTFSFGSSSNAVGGTKSFSLSSSTSFAAPTFSFGSNNPSSGSLTFPTSTGFTFGGVTKPESEKPKEGTEENKDNEEDEPPKVEFKAVVEKDNLFTVRCKVFVRKGDSFGDRGVGNLFLKPIENSEKVQLIVRADTNLGNLLLNFILSESVPTKRMGKKDVMLVAIPTPDAQPPPTPVLIRVKSPEEADKLLEILEKHKK